MMRLLKFLCLTGSLWSAGIAQAQTLEKTDYIDTNRPSFMYSPLVVPKSSIQLENGTTYQWGRKGQWQYGLPESNLRIGIARNTEFQLFLPAYRIFQSDLLASQAVPRFSSGNSGSGDYVSSVATNLSEIGFKYQFGQFFDKPDMPRPLKGMQGALLAGVTVPTGSRAAAELGTEGTVRLPWCRPMRNGWRVAGMQSLLLLNKGENLQYQPTALIGKSLGQKGDAFVEYGGFFTSHQFPIQFMHIGGLYKPALRHGVDAHAGFGLSQSTPIGFVGFGYSYRFDKLSW